MVKAKLAVTLMLVFCLVFVAACSSSNNKDGETDKGTNNSANTNTSTNSSQNNSNNSNNNNEPAPPEPEPEINMNGEELKILHWSPAPDPETAEGALMLEHWAEIESKYNVKIVWEQVPWGEPIKMVTNAALTGESVADFVALDLYFAIPAIKEGLFMPVDEFFDFDDPKWPKNISKITSYKGRTYGINSINSFATGLYFNKTLLEREGQPNPHDLVAQGKWTWEEFLKIAKAVTKDLDGDGVTDQWGIVNTPVNLYRMFIYSNGGSLIKEVDGKMVFPYDDAKTLEALHFYSDLYNVHKVAMPPRGDSWSIDDYNDSQTMFNGGKAAFVTGELWEGAERKTMTDEQGFVYFPKGPGRMDSWSATVENFVAFYIPANVKRAEEKAKIWEEMQMWDRVPQILRENAEQQNLADERDIEVMMDIVNYSEPLFLSIGGAGTDLAYSISFKGESPETIMERNKQVAQDALDQMYNN